jgi:hypothetical protein
LQQDIAILLGFLLQYYGGLWLQAYMKAGAIVQTPNRLVCAAWVTEK